MLALEQGELIWKFSTGDSGFGGQYLNVQARIADCGKNNKDLHHSQLYH